MAFDDDAQFLSLRMVLCIRVRKMSNSTLKLVSRQFEFGVVQLVHVDGGQHVRLGGGQPEGGADEGQG